MRCSSANGAMVCALSTDPRHECDALCEEAAIAGMRRTLNDDDFPRKERACVLSEASHETADTKRFFLCEFCQSGDGSDDGMLPELDSWDGWWPELDSWDGWWWWVTADGSSGDCDDTLAETGCVVVMLLLRRMKRFGDVHRLRRRSTTAGGDDDDTPESTAEGCEIRER